MICVLKILSVITLLFVSTFSVGLCSVQHSSIKKTRNYWSFDERADMAQKAKEMFYHAYDAYMKYAFPHDELKPISRSWTDSLEELGNLDGSHLSDTYGGVALSLIDSLSTLAVMADAAEFRKGVKWLSKNLSFDQDVRVNVFECNIRVLGGLMSAHILASDPDWNLMPDYSGELLPLAFDLGERLLPAFSTPSGIPVAWVNLRRGVRSGETQETSTAGCGSLVLEMGLLSRYTSDPRFEMAAVNAVRAVWDMRDRKTSLLGQTLNASRAGWINPSAGIGAGLDSFYEYLLKAHMVFGEEEFYSMFQEAYLAVLRHLRQGSWYHEADIRTGQPTHMQFTSLQAFWPGLQVLLGDVRLAEETYESFFSLWKEFGVFPERFLLREQVLHPTERYYPLRPELIESTFALYQATQNSRYLDAGQEIWRSLMRYTRVGSGGFASVRDVTSMEAEDHMHSFFLAETCKYLYLLYNSSSIALKNYVFSTEGHLLPIIDRQRQHHIYSPDSESDVASPLPAGAFPTSRSQSRHHRSGISALEAKMCPLVRLSNEDGNVPMLPVCHQEDSSPSHRCKVASDCGICAETCLQRTCSKHGYCK